MNNITQQLPTEWTFFIAESTGVINYHAIRFLSLSTCHHSLINELVLTAANTRDMRRLRGWGPAASSVVSSAATDELPGEVQQPALSSAVPQLTNWKVRSRSQLCRQQCCHWRPAGWVPASRLLAARATTDELPGEVLMPCLPSAVQPLRGQKIINNNLEFLSGNKLSH